MIINYKPVKIPIKYIGMKCTFPTEKMENWTKGLFNNYHKISLVTAEIIQWIKFWEKKDHLSQENKQYILQDLLLKTLSKI